MSRKRCSRCNADRPVSEFYKKSRAADGLRPECKTCTNAANKAYAEKNPDVIRRATASWVANNPEKRRAIKSAWSAKNKDSVRRSNQKQYAKRVAARDAYRAANPELFDEKGVKLSPVRLHAKMFPITQREQQRRYYTANAEKRRESVRKWADKNRDYVRQRGSEYAKNNRHLMNAKQATRRAKKRNATPAWADAGLISRIYAWARLLSQITGDEYVVDHSVPLVHPMVSGLHVPANLQVMLRKENEVKGNRFWPDMP